MTRHPAVRARARRMRRTRLLTRLFTHQQRQTLSMMLLAAIVSVEFFETIMFVFAAGHIMGGVDADPRGFALAQAMYAIGSMVMIVKQQWLARTFGYRRYLTAALCIFIAGTLAAASSGSLNQLVIARFVQGLGGGALFTSSRVLIPMMFSAADRPRATRYFMIGIFAAVALGPAIASELIDHGTWRDVFYGALPLAIVAALGSWYLLPDAESGKRPRQRIWLPLLWFGLAIAALQLAMTDARFDLFSHPAKPLLFAGIGTVMLLGFLRHQWRQESSLLHLRALGNPVYLTGLALYFIYYLISRMNGYLFPIYAEDALRIPLTTVGWLDTLSGIISFVGIVAYIRYAKLLKRKKPMMAVGLLIMAYAAWKFAGMPANVTPGALVPYLAAKGLFGILVVIPVAGLTFRGLGESAFAHGYQSKNLMRQVASSLAASLAAVLLENRHQSVRAALVDSTGRQPGITAQWLDHIQAGLVKHGMAVEQAAHTAMAQLTHVVERQATLIATEDVFRLIALLSIGGALVVLAQRRLA